MGQIKIIKCPHCNREIRRQQDIDSFISLGSPLKKCKYCNDLYYDPDYREIALDNEPPKQEEYKPPKPNKEAEKKKKTLFSGFNRDKKELNEWMENLARSAQQEKAPPSPYEQSEKRLANYDYLLKLYQYGYHKQNPRSEKRLKNRMQKVLSENYVDLLQEKLGAPGNIFKIKNPEEMFDRLTYEAKDEEAVKTIVKEVLDHYGVDKTKHQIQIEYKNIELTKEKGTLGTFTQWKPDGGLIKIVIVPRYSHYDMIIAVILHECAHALLYSKAISLPSEKDNERLTDAAAIYMGGTDYILRGYYAYTSFHIGYLEEIESELINNEVKIRYGDNFVKICQNTAEITRLITNIENRLQETEGMVYSVHPNHTIRNKSIILETQEFFMKWNERSHEIIRITKQYKEKSYSNELSTEKTLDELQSIENEINSYHALLIEWQQAETYQASLPTNNLDYVKQISVNAENGNTFAMLDMIKFWAECPATARDALVYYEQLSKMENNANALYAAGYCCLQGLATEKDIDLGRAFLHKAAALGSKDAINLL